MDCLYMARCGDFVAIEVFYNKVEVVIKHQKQKHKFKRAVSGNETRKP